MENKDLMKLNARYFSSVADLNLDLTVRMLLYSYTLFSLEKNLLQNEPQKP